MSKFVSERVVRGIKDLQTDEYPHIDTDELFTALAKNPDEELAYRSQVMMREHTTVEIHQSRFLRHL